MTLNKSLQTEGSSKHKKGLILRNERHFKQGRLIFIEGETSTEMYIIKSGKVRILKQEGDTVKELAILGSGSVIGELALLDHQPRTATAQVIEDVTAVVIDENLFKKTLASIPSWMKSIIFELVNRLRNTMKKTCDDIVNKNIAGVIRVITLLLKKEGSVKDGYNIIPLTNAKEVIFSIIGLGSIETENIFMHLILKDMILIRKNEIGQEYILIKNLDVINLYMDYLRAKEFGKKMIGEDFTEKTQILLNVLISAAENHGKKLQNNLISLNLSQLEIEHDRLGYGRFIDLDALDQLLDSKILVKQEQSTETKYDSHKKVTLIFNLEMLKKVTFPD